MFLSYQPHRLVEVFAVLPAFTVGIKLSLVTGALARPRPTYGTRRGVIYGVIYFVIPLGEMV